jgi:hypothetical protein
LCSPANSIGKNDASRETSFGVRPKDIKMSKGELMLFGHKTRGDSEIWPANPTSVDQKTGYPKGFDKK